MKTNGWFLGVLLLMGAAEPRNDEAKLALDPLQGGWSAFLVFINGKAVPADEARTGELTIEDDQYRARLGARATTATIKVDPSRSPRHIDLTYTEGELKGKTVKGIYKIAGDVLTICRGLTEKDARPSDFAAPVNSGLLLVTWKRSKTFVSARAKAIDEELKKFTGNWRFVSEEFDGEKLPDEVFQKDTLILKGKQFASFVAGRLVHGEIKIDPLAKPKTIDIIFNEGPGKGHSQKGIYELDGDTQKFCIALPDKPRPTDFVSKPDSGHILQVLQREKR
jgi:uncharacterized protein (TIGR03067 family)